MVPNGEQEQPLWNGRENKVKIDYIQCKEAPRPLGNYSHAIGYGDLVFVSGIAARDFLTDQVPGLRLDATGKKIGYDIRLETRATLENIRKILEDAESGIEDVLDVSVYLLDMKDFGAYNEVYTEYFHQHKPARTTVAVSGLPGNIAIEMKVVARRNSQ